MPLQYTRIHLPTGNVHQQEFTNVQTWRYPSILHGNKSASTAAAQDLIDAWNRQMPKEYFYTLVKD